MNLLNEITLVHMTPTVDLSLTFPCSMPRLQEHRRCSELLSTVVTTRASPCPKPINCINIIHYVHSATN